MNTPMSTPTSTPMSTPTDTPTTDGQGTTMLPRTTKKRSYVWDHFTKNNDLKLSRVIYNYCGVSYACQKKRNGTSNMRSHLETQCKKYPLRLSWEKQSLLSFKVKEGADLLNLTCSLKKVCVQL